MNKVVNEILTGQGVRAPGRRDIRLTSYAPEEGQLEALEPLQTFLGAQDYTEVIGFLLTVGEEGARAVLERFCADYPSDSEMPLSRVKREVRHILRAARADGMANWSWDDVQVFGRIRTCFHIPLDLDKALRTEAVARGITISALGERFIEEGLAASKTRGSDSAA